MACDYLNECVRLWYVSVIDGPYQLHEMGIKVLNWS